MRDATTSALSCARDTGRSCKAGSRRGQYENATPDRPRAALATCCVPCQSISNSEIVAAAFLEHGHDVGLRRAVGIAEHLLRIPERHCPPPSRRNRLLVDENGSTRPSTSFARGGRVARRYRQRQVVILGKQAPRNRCLPGPRRRGQHQHQATPPDLLWPSSAASIMPCPPSSSDRQSRSPASRCAFLYRSYIAVVFVQRPCESEARPCRRKQNTGSSSRRAAVRRRSTSDSDCKSASFGSPFDHIRVPVGLPLQVRPGLMSRPAPPSTPYRTVGSDCRRIPRRRRLTKTPATSRRSSLSAVSSSMMEASMSASPGVL